MVNQKAVNMRSCGKLKAVFLFTNGKTSWMLTGAVSLETVLWAPRTTVKLDAFEGFSNIMHTDLCDI